MFVFVFVLYCICLCILYCICIELLVDTALVWIARMRVWDSRSLTCTKEYIWEEVIFGLISWPRSLGQVGHRDRQVFVSWKSKTSSLTFSQMKVGRSALHWFDAKSSQNVLLVWDPVRLPIVARSGGPIGPHVFYVLCAHPTIWGPLSQPCHVFHIFHCTHWFPFILEV